MPRHISDKAEIHPRAELAADVEVGPFCVLGPQVTIGRGTRLLAQVTLLGPVALGQDNTLYPGVVLGGPPETLDAAPGDAGLSIGDHNVIREGVTINGGSAAGGEPTCVGHHCYLMAGCRVAHDCRLGNRVVIGNGTLLGARTRVHDFATVAGGVEVHPQVTLGSGSYVSGLSRVLHDVPPFLLAEGNPSRVRGVNVVALKRREFAPADVHALLEAYRLIYRTKLGLDEAWELLRRAGQLVPSVNHLLGFLQPQEEGRHGRAREQRRAA
jgi:UDP-N-acetylglucosamine acyltransferase